jgi:arylamine N-acetyltransferase
MSFNPLEPPSDRRLLQAFLRHFRIAEGTEPLALLNEVVSHFSRLPYENLSKIIRYAENGNAVAAREEPQEILAGYLRSGTGGTCFSLTAALLHLVRALGLPAEPILADRSYGPDTHCALLVWVNGVPQLLDPGFLLVRPVDLPRDGERRVATAFHDVILSPRGDRKIDLSTVDQQGRRHRLTFKADPVDAAEFLRAWDASFDWDMMTYPVLTRVEGDRQQYLRGRYHQVRCRGSVVRAELANDDLAAEISTRFGIAVDVVARALSLLDLRRTTQA